MALIQCAECGREVSDKAAACPGCGAPVVLERTGRNHIVTPQMRPRRSAWVDVTIAFVVCICIGLLLLAGTSFFSSGNSNVEPEIEYADKLIRRQVAADIDVEFDKSAARAYRQDVFVDVCGSATLNRPGSGPLALNNETQRVMVRYRPGHGGSALFDGSSSAEGKAEFAALWDQRCR